MTRKATHDRHGSHAGRGFRYQDAVAVMLALQVWAGLSPGAIIVPEGNDDVERQSATGNGLVQIKSRREDLGGLPLASARDYIIELWERHDKFTPPAAQLELILEQGIVDHETTADGGIVPNARLASHLRGKARGKTLLAKTEIRQVSSPNADSIAIITNRMSCSPIAAALCVAQLLHEVGMLADDNGRLKAGAYRGLSAIDTDRIITETLAAIDVEAIEVALRNGACEPTDFLTPLDDPEFYLGVDVQPGHVAAGLVIPRLQPRDALTLGLETRGAALVVGPSGAGKSAIMWDTAHSLRHTIRWYRVLRVDQKDLPALRQLVRTLRANPDSPVGFIVDDIGRRGAEGWDALTLEFAAVPGVVLLGSIREEDLFLLRGRSRAAEVRAEPDRNLARRIFEELKRTGRTEWAGWQEPWTRSQSLVLEYVHILTAGQRFEETLAEQVGARQCDPSRSAELAILRVVALTGATGETAKAEWLPAVLSLPEEDAQLTAMNSVHDAARELTPPAIASSVATGEGSGQFNANVTKLQNLLFAGSADVCRRFHQLPEGAGAFIAWTADLIKDVDEAETQEPWELVGDIPASLSNMRELLVRVRIIAGNAAGGTMHPSASFATLLGKTRPDNALRLVASMVEKRMTMARRELAASIRTQLEADGIEAEVHVVEDPDGILPWPPSKVLIVVPLASQVDIESHVIAVSAAREAVPADIRLTVMPSVNGRVLPTRSVSGYETLLPLPDEADVWIDQLRLPFFRAEISPTLNMAVAKASALQSMDRLSLGVPGRPLVELETRGRLENELTSARHHLVAMIDDLDPEGPALVLFLLDRVRSGEASFADAVQEFTASQVPNAIIREVSSLQIALDDAEFERSRANGDG